MDTIRFAIFEQALGLTLLAASLAFVLAPFLIHILYRFKITRRSEYDLTLELHGRQSKTGTPIMGGLLVILTTTALTYVFNWERAYTYIPIGVMLLGALLGGADDLLNLFGGKPRRMRSLRHTLTLIRVHRNYPTRIWLLCTLPWTVLRTMSLRLGSHPGKGIQVHEKLIFQFLAGAITAGWIFYKLGPEWKEIWIPWIGQVNIGVFSPMLIILAVMLTANAVNVSDGLDGLSGGSLMAAFTGLALISWLQGNLYFTLLNATVVGALIAYTYFNIKPARFQMGDVGSLGLGALLAVMSVAQNRLFLLPFLGCIFFIELGSVIIQTIWRTLFGVRLFKMSPLHYHLTMIGWSEEKIVMRFWVIQIFMVVLALWISVR